MTWEHVIQISISNFSISVTYDYRRYAIWLHSGQFRLMMKVDDVKDLSMMLRGAVDANESMIAFQTEQHDKVYIDDKHHQMRFIQFREDHPVYFYACKDDVDLMVRVLDDISSFVDNSIIRMGPERFGIMVTHLLAYTIRFFANFTNTSSDILANQLVDNYGPFMPMYYLLEDMMLRKNGNNGDGDADGICLNKRMAIDLVYNGIQSSQMSMLVAYSLIARNID